MFDLFQPDDLVDKVTPENAGWKPLELRAQDMAPWTPPPKADESERKDGNERPQPVPTQAAALGFRGLNDLAEVKISDGQLTGDITGSAPILHFALRENRGGADSVKFIEVKMNVSGAKHVWLRPERSALLDDEALLKWATSSEPWNTSADVVDNKLHTYRFEIRSSRSGRAGSPGGGPPAVPPGGGPPGRGPAGGPGDGGNVMVPPPGGPGGPPPAGPWPGPFPDFPRGPRPDGVARGPGPGGPPPGAMPPGPVGPPPAPAGGGGGSRSSSQESSDLRHFALSFRECKSAKFAIESLRIVSEREEKLKDASGQQWAGLGEIYRATLAAKTPELIRIPLRQLPNDAWLDFAVGTKEDAPITFKLTISQREGAKESAAAKVFERTVTIPNRWQTARVDLRPYAGKSVVAEFAVSGEKKGLWGYWGAPTVRSHPATAGSGTAQAVAKGGRKPLGVIFLVTDTLRKDHLNIYGYPRETVVHLKKFADEGVAFSHVISQGTMTKISIPSMVTSLYPLSHTVLGFEKGLPASAKTLAEVFREEGYATVAYSSVPFTGKANNMHQGYDELHEVGSISDSDYRSKTARHYVDRLIPWLEEHRDVPFFVFLHVFDPHSPFRPRPPYDTMWAASGSRDRLADLEADMRKKKIRTGMDNLPTKEEYLKTGNSPDELLKIYKDWYDGSIRGMDAEIGRLLEALRELGLEQDTLMVWGADHGEEFWEHGRMFHGHSVYGELNQVPLVFRWPNNPEIRKGAMVGHLVENLDIMPTILGLVGIQGPTNMQGRSLLPLLNGSGLASWQERPAITHAMVGRQDGGPPGGGGGGGGGDSQKPHFGIIHGGWKLVRKEADPEVEELYEHPMDSLDLTNVIKSTGTADHQKGLAKTFDTWKTGARAAQLPNDETMTAELSSEELRRLRALGYVGGGTTPRPETNAPANALTNAPAPVTVTNVTTAAITNGTAAVTGFR